jgi:hypothetical protein
VGHVGKYKNPNDLDDGYEDGRYGGHLRPKKHKNLIKEIWNNGYKSCIKFIRDNAFYLASVGLIASGIGAYINGNKGEGCALIGSGIGMLATEAYEKRKEGYKDRIIKKQINELHRENKELKYELEKANRKIENLKMTKKEQHEVIRELNRQIRYFKRHLGDGRKTKYYYNMEYESQRNTQRNIFPQDGDINELYDEVC